MKTEVTDPSIQRKALVPIWMRVFGWLFVLVGAFALLLIVAGLLPFIQLRGDFSVFGLDYYGSVTDRKALALGSVFIGLGLSAYGFLLGRAWGLLACILMGYASLSLCAASLWISGFRDIPMEPLVLVPYVVKLHRMWLEWRPIGRSRIEP